MTWPFILLLVAAFVANQSFKRHYIRFSFQISLFFLSIYSFAIFLVPVVLHRIGTWVFLLSGAASLAFIGLFIVILFHFIKDKSVRDKYESRKMIALLILGIFAIVNALYFTNLIPPIPLSLKEGGVYHSVEKVAGGNYYVSDEKHSWKDYFRLFKTFTAAPGAGAYAYSAVFSPRNLNITILHEWQYYDESERAWATTGIISLPVIGGRDGGFRTYSMRSNLTPGKWRVNVETTEGKIIGRLRFNVIAVSTPRSSSWEKKNNRKKTASAVFFRCALYRRLDIFQALHFLLQSRAVLDVLGDFCVAGVGDDGTVREIGRRESCRHGYRLPSRSQRLSS
ncbi:MAG: DUF2914 domain-containing protein [bacterium]